ncbi:hypothetical protein FUA23_06365 [Neolewinella aurantiaca]|uniref:Uncharacterized protein n=1 Tax=Neolewinella aurantiaca TaxID=2602767 RepID=A0A5C7FYX6_9BACT|nr:DUF2071 domain-containing protein [Neolewinella aurantiaca]TXF90411.1 hypothetical protein FUA23_06365 [Neolewinella aurantiaca]
MNPLKRHPFPVAAHFRQSLVLTFALPQAALARRLPPPLRLDTFEDQHAFVAVAMVQTEALRPKGFPRWLGNDFFLAGYRIFVRYTSAAGKKLRGLYILESQTDKRKMELMGNLMTHYNYTKIGVEQVYGEEEGRKTYGVRSPTENFVVKVRYDDDPALPEGSPFADWKEARRFAGPLPFTFTYDAENQNVLIVEGVRQNWKPQPVTVEHYSLPWLNRNGLSGAVLASAFVVEDIPYWWRKGKVEPWEH